MRHLLIVIATALLAVLPGYAQNVNPQAKPQSVGLVLSGGGAKGIAHIGLLQALEDANIPIDYITGTSMGAIVGGLYAAGYTPAEMMKVILSKDFSYWSTGKIDPALSYNFIKPDPSPALGGIDFGARDSSATSVPASIISPLPMNFAFMQMFSAYTAQCKGNFDKLMVPFRCIASDVRRHHKVVLKSGNLGDAIRASMSFPLVFQATQIDTMLLYDGGIYDNFPVDVMRETYAPDIMIGVDVAQSDKGPQTSLLDQISNLVIQNHDYSMPKEEGIKIRINLDEFSLLDFPKAQAIYDVGYNTAKLWIDSISRRVTSRTLPEVRALRRAVFKSQSPYVRFDSVSVSGASPARNDYLAHLFIKHKADTFGIAHAREAYYQALSSGLLRDLKIQSHYNDSTRLFKLSLKASVKDAMRLSVGGWMSSSANSYLYLSAAYSRLSFNSLAASVSAWIGQSYMGAMLSGRIYLRTGIPTALSIQGVFSRNKFSEGERYFFQESLPTFILKYQYFSRLRWSAPATRAGIVELGVGYGHLYDSFFRNNRQTSYQYGRDRAYHDLGQAYLRMNANTLDAVNYPTSGYHYDISVMGLSGQFKQETANPNADNVRTYPTWLQTNLRGSTFLGLAKHFSLGLEGDFMLSTRKLEQNYNAAVVSAPGYMPTPSSHNRFIPGLRANSYLGVGVIPVYKYNDNLSARVSTNMFLPLRRIEAEYDGRARYGQWLRNPEFMGEFAIAYQFPFGASLSAYTSYYSTPSANWSVGINFGIFLQAPDFLR